MCTAITWNGRYFGRTLDYEQSFGESVVITPRNLPLEFRQMPALQRHYALVGMAAVEEGYPLYYDAVNEKGLGMAGLMFAGYAQYSPLAAGRENIAPFELIPWILGQCADLRDVQGLLERINVAELPFSEKLPAAPLHWMIADRERAVTLESVAGGLKLYENPAGVLTNSPPFDHQLLRLQEHQQLSPEPREGYSRGLGAVGLPGDWSSPSRFVRAAFVRQHGRCGEGEQESVSHFFRLLGAVTVPKGCLRTAQGDAYTRYTCCCDQERGIYYYTTYEDPAVRAVRLYDADLNGKMLQFEDGYDMIRKNKLAE